MPLCRCAAGPTASTAKHASEHCEQTNFLLTEAASCRIDLLCRDAGRTPRSLLRQVDAPNPRSRIVFLEAVREDSAIARLPKTLSHYALPISIFTLNLTSEYHLKPHYGVHELTLGLHGRRCPSSARRPSLRIDGCVSQGHFAQKSRSRHRSLQRQQCKAMGLTGRKEGARCCPKAQQPAAYAHVFYRPMKSCAETQTSTTNIYPSQAW